MKTIKSMQSFRRTAVAVLVAGGVGAAGTAQAGPSFQHGDQGFLQLDYALQIWAQNRGYTSADDDGDTMDTFLRRNRITFQGQFSDYVGFYAQLEAGNDSKGGNNERSVYYRDAYLTLDYSDSLRFLAGRFKNTFSRENLEACLEPLTLDRSENIAYTPFGGTRDTGLAMWGNLADAMFQYRLMVSDGREGEETVSDQPRVTARAHVSLLDPEYSYGYRGTYTGTQNVLTIGAAYDQQADVAYGEYPTREEAKDYSATTVDVYYEQPFDFGTVTLSGAVMDYTVDDAFEGDTDDSLTPWAEREGNYVKAGYMLPGTLGLGRLQLFGRSETVEYGDGTGLSDHDWASAGANYYIDGQRLKVTLEHAEVEFDEEDPDDPTYQDYGQTTVGLQMQF
ncbi:MAG: selenite/tellurite reduction operon porin ExtI [Thiohalospira sp.]